MLVRDADLLDLIIPMDAFAEELTHDELPAHLEREELETRRLSRVVPPWSPTDDRKGYFQIYSDLIKDNEFFFLGTMSDVFLRTYKQSESGTGDPLTSWDSFREHVWGYVQDMHDKKRFDPAVHLDMDNHQHLYPVYYEPDPENPRTRDGEMKPKLDWNDDHYSLRGLQYVLERIGQ